MMRSLIFFMIIVALMQSCGYGSRSSHPGQQTGTIGDSVVVMQEDEGQACVRDPDGFYEDCTVLAVNSLGGIRERISIEARFRLRPQGELTIRAFARGEQNQDGVNMHFRRDAGSNLDLEIEVLGNRGPDNLDYTENFSEVDASEEIHFVIDIHNDETPAHIVFWQPHRNSFNLETNLINTACPPSRESIAEALFRFSLRDDDVTAEEIGMSPFYDCHDLITEYGQGRRLVFELKDADLTDFHVEPARWNEGM